MLTTEGLYKLTGGMLQDKVVIITGAARGLGEAHARACAAEGATVVATDISQDAVERVAEELRSGGGEALAAGGLDGLVNNAAIVTLNKPLEETEDMIRRAFEVNVYGSYFMAIAAGEAMDGKGSIVNVSGGSQSGTPYSAIYGATKGAISSLTYNWAMDLAAAGSEIRVNALSPHAATPMMAESAEFFKANGIDSLLKSDAPDLSRVSPVVVYLLSDSSSQVNGQVVRMEDVESLSITTHPASLHPPLYRDAWKPQDIAAAFEAELADRQFPTGQRYITASVVEPPSIP